MFISDKVSLAKVEKVVNPPQKPAISKNLRLLSGTKLTNKPIQKQPRTLTINVTKGNVKGSSLPIYTEARKRIILPAAPPVPTNNICFINIFFKIKILSPDTTSN